jgi:hypothetical protein
MGVTGTPADRKAPDSIVPKRMLPFELTASSVR